MPRHAGRQPRGLRPVAWRRLRDPARPARPSTNPTPRPAPDTRRPISYFTEPSRTNFVSSAIGTCSCLLWHWTVRFVSLIYFARCRYCDARTLYFVIYIFTQNIDYDLTSKIIKSFPRKTLKVTCSSASLRTIVSLWFPLGCHPQCVRVSGNKGSVGICIRGAHHQCAWVRKTNSLSWYEYTISLQGFSKISTFTIKAD